MKEYSRWKDSEVKELFTMIENNKKCGKSLLSVFSEYAAISGRKRNSVRNYYYQEIAALKNDSVRAQKLGINLDNHTVVTANLFSENEERECLKQILKYEKEGMSIRKACLTLAENNIDKMVRYQNKYRSVLKNNPELLNEIRSELKIEKKENLNNVVYFKKKQTKTISENDINSLFLGLIKLVKKSAAESVEKKILSDLEASNSSLRKALIQLSKTEQELKEVKTKLEIQKSECEKIKLENIYLKTEVAKILSGKQKTKSLSDFMLDFKDKQVN